MVLREAHRLVVGVLAVVVSGGRVAVREQRAHELLESVMTGAVERRGLRKLRMQPLGQSLHITQSHPRQWHIIHYVILLRVITRSDITHLNLRLDTRTM